MSAVEESAMVNLQGLCEIWQHWRDSSHCEFMLHGFLMLSGLRASSDAWDEIQFLIQLLMVKP